MNHINVLNVNMSLDPVTGGGTAERTVQLSRALIKAGHTCTILILDIGFSQEQAARLNNINIVRLPCINRRFYVPRFSYRQVSKIVSEADVVHIMGHWTFISALVYIIVRQQKKPYVVCPAGALPLFGRSKIIKRLYNLIIGKRIICNADRQIAITSDEIRHFTPYGVDADQITIIPNGINLDDFKDARTELFRRRYGLGDHPFILFVGRLNYVKGPDLLLRVFCAIKNKFPKYHLVFIGPDGGMLPELLNVAAQHNAHDQVHFLGYVGGEGKSQAYHAAELLVIPSRQEAMSIVVLEAGAAGTPVLLTEQCGFNEVAQVGGGKVVPATADGIQEGLLEILSNPERLQSMGHNLKHYVCEHFTWENAVNEYIAMYHQILNDKN